MSSHEKIEREIFGYKYEARREKAMGGWENIYYYAEAPDGEEVASGFTTSEDIQDAVDTCLARIMEHYASQAWLAGVKKGIWCYAVWNDGEQLVGSPEKKLKQAYLDVDEGVWPKEHENPYV